MGERGGDGVGVVPGAVPEMVEPSLTPCPSPAEWERGAEGGVRASYASFSAPHPAHPSDPGHPVNRILVVGYGNPLREDDGAGWYVADRVAELLGDTVRVLRLHQLTPEVSTDLAEADLAIFVDARADDPDRGVEVRPVEPTDEPTRSHHCSPGALLVAARTLFGATPTTYLVSIPAYSFGYAEALTSETRTAAEEATQRIYDLIQSAR